MDGGGNGGFLKQGIVKNFKCWLQKLIGVWFTNVNGGNAGGINELIENKRKSR